MPAHQNCQSNRASPDHRGRFGVRRSSIEEARPPTDLFAFECLRDALNTPRGLQGRVKRGRRYAAGVPGQSPPRPNAIIALMLVSAAHKAGPTGHKAATNSAATRGHAAQSPISRQLAARRRATPANSGLRPPHPLRAAAAGTRTASFQDETKEIPFSDRLSHHRRED